MALSIKPASEYKRKSLFVLSRDTGKAINHALSFLSENCNNPLVVAFGNTEVFADCGYDVAYVGDFGKFGDVVTDIVSASSNYDGLFIDSLTFLRRILNTKIAEDGGIPKIQDYGAVNIQLTTMVTRVQNATPTFVTTGAFVLNEDASNKASTDVWEFDFTSNLRAGIFPKFGSIVYVAPDGTVVSDRDLAVQGKKPSKAPSLPQIN
jgi:hypothetical protein